MNMKYDFVKEINKNSFYQVSLDEISEAERDLGIIFPGDLKDFYLEVGYGFIEGWEYNVNRIMDPYSVRDFRLRQGDFEFYPDIEIYSEVEQNKLIFFEANESALMSIGFGADNDGVIYCYDVKIAESLEEFLYKIQNNDRYYIELV